MKNLFKTIDTEIVIGEEILPVTIKIFTEPDEWPEGDFDFGNAEENAAYLNRFVTGELECVCILVEATALGEQGFDSLGMCHVKDEADVKSLIRDHEMTLNALGNLREAIKSKAKLLSKYA